MDSDDFMFWAIILGAIGVAFAAVIGSSYVVCHHIERMAELGYEEEPVPGSSRLMWRRRTPPKDGFKWDLTPAQPVAPQDIIESLTNDVPRSIIDYISTNAPLNLYEFVSVEPEQINAWTNGLVASIEHLRGEISCLIRNSERLEGKVENRIRPPDVTCAKCGKRHVWSDLLNCYVGAVTNGWIAP